MSLTRNIIGCWSPSLGASGYLLRDVSGLNNHGTLTNMDPGTDWVASTAGIALNGDAVNNMVVTALRLPTQNMSYCGWVNVRVFSGFPGNRPFGEADSANGLSGTTVILRSTGPFCAFRGGTATDINGSSTITAGVWYHFAVVLGSRPEVWQNGQLVAFSTGTTIASRNVGFRILSDDVVNNNFGINGLVNDVVVYNRAITGPEIAELYRRGNGWLGRELTGMHQRRTYGKKLGNRRRRLLCGGIT